MFIDTLKKYYKKNPVLISIGIIIASIGAFLTLWSFFNLVLQAYNAYSTYSVGTQILLMTALSIVVNIILILLVTAYLSVRIGELKNKKE
jgi:membrane-associated HD superfamily phosphohydrolase